MVFSAIAMVAFSVSGFAQPYAASNIDFMICNMAASAHAANAKKGNPDLPEETLEIMRNSYYQGCMDQRTKNVTTPSTELKLSK